MNDEEIHEPDWDDLEELSMMLWEEWYENLD